MYLKLFVDWLLNSFSSYQLDTYFLWCTCEGWREWPVSKESSREFGAKVERETWRVGLVDSLCHDTRWTGLKVCHHSTDARRQTSGMWVSW